MLWRRDHGCLESYPADRVAATAAEEVDAFLLAVPDEVVEAGRFARPDRPNLDRGFHRDHHLDRIERALAEAGYAWPRHRTGHGRGRPHAHRVGVGAEVGGAAGIPKYTVRPLTSCR